MLKIMLSVVGYKICWCIYFDHILLEGEPIFLFK